MSFINRIPVNVLANVAAGGGIVAVVFAMIVKRGMLQKVEQQPYCREPVKLLRNHEGAKHVLGDGFQLKGVKEESFRKKNTTEDKATFIFPVKGSKGSGTFTIRAKCEPKEDSENLRTCLVHQCDLAVEKSSALEPDQYEGKLLVIYNRDRHGPLAYEVAKDKS